MLPVPPPAHPLPPQGTGALEPQPNSCDKEESVTHNQINRAGGKASTDPVLVKYRTLDSQLVSACFPTRAYSSYYSLTACHAKHVLNYTHRFISSLQLFEAHTATHVFTKDNEAETRKAALQGQQLARGETEAIQFHSLLLSTWLARVPMRGRLLA